MKAREFTGFVRDGKLPPEMGNAIRGLLRLLEGERIVVAIRKWEKPRSIRQNRFYWDVVIGIVIGMFRDMGEAIDKDQAHEFLQREVLKRTRTFRGLEGNEVTVTLSSTKKTVADWEADNEIIRAWAASWGYHIPRPGEITEIMY